MYTLLDVCFIFLPCLSPYMYQVSPVSTLIVLGCSMLWWASKFWTEESK